ncbi:hypothetical protein D3C71_1955160 [compost metagenome]
MFSVQPQQNIKVFVNRMQKSIQFGDNVQKQLVDFQLGFHFADPYEQFLIAIVDSDQAVRRYRQK